MTEFPVLTEDEVSAVIGLLRDVAAAEIMPRFKHLGRGDVRTNCYHHRTRT